MSAMQPDLFGSLPYPEVGTIAVTADGSRIAVWPNESDDPHCFTGQLLEPDASYAKAVVFNLSVFWRRDCIVRLEPATPSDNDAALMIFDEATP